MNEDTFVIFMEHFIRQTNCSTNNPVLLILDRHESYISLSSEESDISIPLNDTTDYESSDVQNEEDDDGDKDLSAGNFVIVKFAGKTKSYNYIGLVEKVDGADISAKFLKRSNKSSADRNPIFIFKENDGVIPRKDVRKKLPPPQKLGGTARREQKFTYFPL
ncbi:hypothetical protein WMY93_021954 [Mugilogobius chulae]|uniref:Uncharacterized protein n=1 Tax=Mugilogobius chulae TaxID=88201 RepID=A0AAW0NM55_9GOBI